MESSLTVEQKHLPLLKTMHLECSSVIFQVKLYNCWGQLAVSVSLQTRPPIEPLESRCVRDEWRSAARNQHSRAKVHLQLHLIIVYREHVLNKRCFRGWRKSSKTEDWWEWSLVERRVVTTACIKVRSAVTVTGQQKHPAISILLNKCQLRVGVAKW